MDCLIKKIMPVFNSKMDGVWFPTGMDNDAIKFFNGKMDEYLVKNFQIYSREKAYEHSCRELNLYYNENE